MSVMELRQIAFARPWLTDEDRRAVLAVLEGPILTHGPQGSAFESEFVGALGGEAHAVAVSSCMAALHLAYLVCGIGPGDEVIVPAQTHTATVHAVEWVGARPVFVDCDPATGNVTPTSIAAAVTARTKAVGIVHFVGIPCEMPAIMALARQHHLWVIEDCALALGARYDGIHAGLFGDVGCFSFYPAKHLTTGEGGMFVTRDRRLAAAAVRLRTFGVERTSVKAGGSTMYDVTCLGLNYRMSELHAALGRSQLRRLAENVSRRRTHFERLKGALERLGDLRVLDATTPQAQSGYYCLSAVLEGRLRGRRDEVIAHLHAAGIGTSVYYPHPVPRLGYYRAKYGYQARQFPRAEELSDQSIALPVGPHLLEEDLAYLIEQVGRVVQELRP